MRLQNNLAPEELPQFPDFTPFSSVPREVYEAYISKYEPYSDFGYTSLYVWGRDDEQYVSQYKGNLIISMKDYMSNQRIFTFIGDEYLDDTAKVLLDFAADNQDYVDELKLIPEYVAGKLSQSQFSVSEDRDNHDYILSSEKFLELAGRSFSHTRRKLSQFKRGLELEGKSITVEPASIANSQTQREIISLSCSWAEMGTEGSSTADEEIGAIRRLISDIELLNSNKNIHCLLLKVDTEVAGFCVFEIRDSYAIVHFIKGNLNYSGASDFMMVAMMRAIYNDYHIYKVNHEQDLGILGLRAAKEHYSPVGFLKKFVVSR